jgi:predicted MPP superfamily phosphohydrolase
MAVAVPGAVLFRAAVHRTACPPVPGIFCGAPPGNKARRTAFLHTKIRFMHLLRRTGQNKLRQRRFGTRRPKGDVFPLYSHFIQFTLPRIGQGFVAAVLYGNFLFLPFFVWLWPAHPLLFWLLPAALTAAAMLACRNPLHVGMIWTAYLTALYLISDALCLIFWRIGGGAWRIWQALYAGGLSVWVLTALLIGYGRIRAHTLRVTRYTLSTPKALPGGHLRIVQLSDLHPGSTMNARRIPELRERIEALRPDLIVLTGDVFDETTPRTEFEAFGQLFAELAAPLGKWFVFGNHDLGHHWRDPQYDRADLETMFSRAKVRVLEDVAVLAGRGETPHPVRLVGRKDWLYTEHKRFSPWMLMPAGPDAVYTIVLDHEPRELWADAAAGADLILCGHTHGGQIWPLGLLSKLFRYNDVNYGYKQITPTCAAIVSGGTGTWSYQVRTEGRTEIVCVDITQSGVTERPRA